MKTINKTALVLCTLSLCTLFVACNKWDNSFAVNGDCKIDSLVLDTYAGVVDHAARTVVVGVPENHDDQQMTITLLNLSAGATASHKVGDRVNMTTPMAIRVENGKAIKTIVR